jgi:hypothetical protein
MRYIVERYNTDIGWKFLITSDGVANSTPFVFIANAKMQRRNQICQIPHG